MKLFSTHISPQDIILSTDYNLHPWEIGKNDEELNESFKDIGILHPPIVKVNGSGKFVLISGYKRLSFALRTNDQPILCHIIPDDCGVAELLRVILIDQQQNRDLTLAEKARFLKIASSLTNEGPILAYFAKNLRLAPRIETISQATTILNQPLRFIEAIHSSFLDEKIAFDLLSLVSIADRMAIFDLFLKLQMGWGKQRKFLLQLKELSQRKEMSFSDLLAQPDFQKIVEHPEMNGPQKVQRLNDLMTEYLTPHLTTAQKLFTERVKRLKIPSNWSIAGSQSFERDTVTLTIEYESFDQLEKHLPGLEPNSPHFIQEIDKTGGHWG